ncbi:MAG: preprotein translocase subunit SecE [Steroidobacteraceae bacterium]
MNEQVQEQGAGRGYGFALWAGIALALAGVAGFYVLGGQPAWVRWLVVVAGIGAGALVFGLSPGGREFRQFVADARNELRKVFWPTRQETWMTTLVVFIGTVFMGVFFWLLDLFLAWATKALTGQ